VASDIHPEIADIGRIPSLPHIQSLSFELVNPNFSFNRVFLSSQVQNRRIDILLVEDDEVDIMNVQRTFRKQNVQHRLEVARDGMEALSQLRAAANKPHVILLDINMPRMNGLEFLRELRSDPALARIAVFVMSTSSNPSDKSTAFQFNVAGYIVKPLSSEDFNHSLACLVRFWEICEFPEQLYSA
jgi:CheY-like chemotaxis protein